MCYNKGYFRVVHIIWKNENYVKTCTLKFYDKTNVEYIIEHIISKFELGNQSISMNLIST